MPENNLNEAFVTVAVVVTDAAAEGEESAAQKEVVDIQINE